MTMTQYLYKTSNRKAITLNRDLPVNKNKKLFRIFLKISYFEKILGYLGMFFLNIGSFFGKYF